MIKCPECQSPLGDVGMVEGEDAGSTTEWGCTNPKCLSSIHYRGSKCPQCGARPKEVAEDAGKLVVVCKQGHRYPSLAKR